MSVKIRFAQGVNVGNTGEALVGVITTTVVASDGNASPGAISHYRWTWIDVPSTSTFPLGLVTEGPVSAISFNPDVPGDYHLMVEAFAVSGFKTVDRRVFRVPLASGRALPAFDAEADALNFLGQTRGWKPDMEAWLRYVDSLVSAGSGSQGAQYEHQTRGAIAGSFAASGVFSPATGVIAPAATGLAATGFIRTPASAGTSWWTGKSGASDANILSQAGTALTFGDSLLWSLNASFSAINLWSRVTDGKLQANTTATTSLTWRADGTGGSLHAGASSAIVASWQAGGFQIGATASLGGATNALGMAAGTAPSTNPTAGIVLWVDGSDGNALKYRKPDASIVKVENVSVTLYDPTTNGFRLSSTSGQSVPIADVTTVNTIYLLPHVSGIISLYTGTAWTLRSAAGSTVSINLSGLTVGKNYDLFAYWTGSAIALELGTAWTSDTTRAVSVVRSNEGVLVKSGDQTRRYVGTFRATAANASTDTAAQRFIYNENNQVERSLLFTTATASWFYASATVRQANGLTGAGSYRVEFVNGSPTPVRSQIASTWFASTTTLAGVAGIGVDSTSTSSSVAQFNVTGTGNAGTSNATWEGTLAAGYHALNWLESCTGATRVDFYGTTGAITSNLRAQITM